MIQPQNTHSIADFQESSTDVDAAAMDRLDLHESAAAITRGLQDIQHDRFKTLGDFDQSMREQISRAQKGA